MNILTCSISKPVPAPSITDGLLVLVQLVMAAITIEPCFKVNSSPSNVNGTDTSSLSSGIAKPCNVRPTIKTQTNKNRLDKIPAIPIHLSLVQK